MNKEWRECAGFPNYEVSNLGEVRRVRGHLAGRTNKPRAHSDGYLSYTLTVCGHQKQEYAHRLVARTFLGPAPSPEMEVAHKDGTKVNNHVENLKWATPAENQRDRVLHGTHSRGEANRRAKLSEASLPEIQSLAKAGRSQRAIAAAFAMSQSQIGRILRGESWSYPAAARIAAQGPGIGPATPEGGESAGSVSAIPEAT